MYRAARYNVSVSRKTTEELTAEMVANLRKEAEKDGDERLAKACARAWDGDVTAKEACAAAINAKRSAETYPFVRVVVIPDE